tara:strand:+ start:2274 stop:2666 length:393 start_codon:yes stop_codon:yes gene_type:complete
MLKKGAKIYSILFGVCPKCHKEPMYIIKNPYHLYTTLKMHESCKHCTTKYKIEPSFFYGSMYVSYIVGVAFSVASFIITHLFLERSLKMSFAAIVITLVCFMPVIMRLSRNIWINLFMNYDPKMAEKSKP